MAESPDGRRGQRTETRPETGGPDRRARNVEPELRRAAGLIAITGIGAFVPLMFIEAVAIGGPLRLVGGAVMILIGAAVVVALGLVYMGGPWRVPFVVASVALDAGAVLGGAMLPIGLDVAVALSLLSGMMLVAVLGGRALRLGLAFAWVAGVLGCYLSRAGSGLSGVPNASPPLFGAGFMAVTMGLGFIALDWAAEHWRTMAAASRRATETATAALEESRRSYRRAQALMDASPLPIMAFDRDGYLYAWNPAAGKLLGWTEEEVLGRSVAILVPEARHTEVMDRLRRTIATGRVPPPRVTEFLARDGRRTLAEVHDSIEHDSTGRPMGVVVQFLDVTEREAASERLAETRRLEAVGQLAGGIAHDFNNSLTAIAGFASLIASGASATPEQDAQTILDAAEHSAILTRQLLAFSRRVPLQPHVVDLRDFARGLEPLARSLVGETATLHLEMPPDEQLIEIDSVTLEQAVLNLVANARDAMPDGGDLTIAVRRVHGCVDGEQPEPEDHVAIVVSDTGIGIPAADLPHIFEPFFTTKPVGKGTGLGLPMVHGFVTQSGGHVVVSSPPGQGATLELHFRPATGKPAAVEERERAVGGGESVLFVEDDPGVASFGLACLRRLGYDVTPAMNGSEAVALASSRDVPFDLLLTDVVIPGMSGPELAAKIHQHHPTTAILFASGYGADRFRTNPDTPIEPLLEKPYSLETLAQKVREILDSQSAGLERQAALGDPGAAGGAPADLRAEASEPSA